MFLEQYWGGPRTYSDQRGHPRLRMRHIPFQIGFLERDAWLRCMHTAVAADRLATTLDDEHRRRCSTTWSMAAQSMVNSRHVCFAREQLAQDQGGVAAAAIDRAEPRVDAQPRRQHTHPHDLVGGHRSSRAHS